MSQRNILKIFCKTTLKTSEYVNIIKDKKDWAALKEPKKKKDK